MSALVQREGLIFAQENRHTGAQRWSNKNTPFRRMNAKSHHINLKLSSTAARTCTRCSTTFFFSHTYKCVGCTREELVRPTKIPLTVKRKMPYRYIFFGLENNMDFNYLQIFLKECPNCRTLLGSLNFISLTMKVHKQ